MYVLLMTYLTLFTSAYDFYKVLEWGFTQQNGFVGKNNEDLGKNVMIMIAFILNFIVVCLMTAFLKFHIMLASENKTTIENLLPCK